MNKLLFVLAFAPAGFSQAPTAPPPIVRMTCQSGFSRGPELPYAYVKAAVDVLGMSSVTGIPQTWTIELHNNFASIEDLDKAIAATDRINPRDGYAEPHDELLAPPRAMIALYEPELSYRPDEAVRLLPKARYMGIAVHRIRLGMEAEFEQLVRLRKFTADSINLNRPELAYRVVSGAPAGTYLLMAPLVNLRSMDEGVPDLPPFAAPVLDERAKNAAKEAEVEIGREHLIFRLEPRLSYVSDEFAAVDEAFWRVK